MADGPGAGLALLDALAADRQVARWPHFHVARADCLRRLDRRAEAASAYRAALDLEPSLPERRFLRHRLAEVESG